MFREIGYADELGSGMRNTNKYTKLYSGGTPKFVEENTFEIIIPIEEVPELQVGGNNQLNSEEVPKSVEEVKKERLEGQQLQIYNYLLANKSITSSEVEKMFDVKDRRARKSSCARFKENILVAGYWV